VEASVARRNADADPPPLAHTFPRGWALLSCSHMSEKNRS
jgi:hypothetical protein